MNGNTLSQKKVRRRFSFRKLALLTVLFTLTLASTGCASFSSSMSTAPEHSGPPPYADDPEANGNPAKAWWN